MLIHFAREREKLHNIDIRNQFKAAVASRRSHIPMKFVLFPNIMESLNNVVVFGKTPFPLSYGIDCEYLSHVRTRVLEGSFQFCRMILHIDDDTTTATLSFSIKRIFASFTSAFHPSTPSQALRCYQIYIFSQKLLCGMSNVTCEMWKKMEKTTSLCQLRGCSNITQFLPCTQTEPFEQ